MRQQKGLGVYSNRSYHFDLLLMYVSDMVNAKAQHTQHKCETLNFRHQEKEVKSERYKKLSQLSYISRCFKMKEHVTIA